jgi:hypothetical protein
MNRGGTARSHHSQGSLGLDPRPFSTCAAFRVTFTSSGGKARDCGQMTRSREETSPAAAPQSRASLTPSAARWAPQGPNVHPCSVTSKRKLGTGTWRLSVAPHRQVDHTGQPRHWASTCILPGLEPAKSSSLVATMVLTFGPADRGRPQTLSDRGKGKGAVANTWATSAPKDCLNSRATSVGSSDNRANHSSPVVACCETMDVQASGRVNR